jgi:hypothetical protein
VKYFAKLVLGGTYKIKTKSFEHGAELAVTKEEHDYLATCHEKRLVSQGQGYKVVEVPRFELREEHPSKEEQALEDIKDSPTKLVIKKPTAKAD